MMGREWELPDQWTFLPLMIWPNSQSLTLNLLTASINGPAPAQPKMSQNPCDLSSISSSSTATIGFDSKTDPTMEITLQHLHLYIIFLLCGLVRLTHSDSVSANNTSSYSQCFTTTCGESVLQFPFGRNSLCRSAYITTLCENGTVFITDDENPYIKYKLLQDLTNQVYSNNSIRIVDISLFGCGSLPPFSGPSPSAGYQSQKWVMLGAFHYASGYRTGTFFNCTSEPDQDTLSKLTKVPCLECGETNNSCYFYDGYIGHIANCIPFRAAIPVKVFNNFSGVGNLRKVLEEGFEIEWNGICNMCMERGGGRCGYLNQDRKSGEELCFCNDGVHKRNCSDGSCSDGICSDGAIIDLDDASKGPRSNTGKIVMIVGIVVGTTLFLCSCYIYYKRRRDLKQSEFRGEDEQVLRRYLEREDYATPASIETFLRNYTLGRPTRFSYKQLKKYTNNFTHKLGQGGYGSVFKGQLPNGFIIAVKILDETEQSEIQFLNEVQTIGQIHHNHLVRLLGFCFEQLKRALIYEFMVNGSLEKYIRKENPCSKEKLTWSQLLNIAIGTAKGIAYLHEECQSRILHCDIKPHNILLDDNFKPKVSDFGLALALNRENSHASLTRGMGTPGYAPPEMWWMNCGAVTEKSDVYSFGVVVLEMAGKRKNFEVDVSKSSEMYFPEWVFSHHVMSMNGDNGGGSKWHACEGKEEEAMARRMEFVGLWCIQFEPSKRPTMRKVLDMLEGNVVVEIPPEPFDATISAHGRGSDDPIVPQLGSLMFHGNSESK